MTCVLQIKILNKYLCMNVNCYADMNFMYGGKKLRLQMC